MSSKFINTLDRQVFSLSPVNKWLKNNLHYEVIMGSTAYGVSTDSSDLDIYGWAIPPKTQVFPHLSGYITGFGPPPERFEQFQQHHINDDVKGVEYDFTIYNVVKYLQLVVENNPNMVDSLFVPQNCITHITTSGQILRDARKKFFHKGAYQKFKGYAYSQIHKIRTKQTHDNMSTKRRESIEKYGLDVKFAYHAVRLADECEQILVNENLDLQRNREQLKAIRRGEWSLDQLNDWFSSTERHLEECYQNSKLPDKPNWKLAQQVLYSILENHYGSLSEVVKYDRSEMLLSDLQSLITRYQ